MPWPAVQLLAVTSNRSDSRLVHPQEILLRGMALAASPTLYARARDGFPRHWPLTAVDRVQPSGMAQSIQRQARGRGRRKERERCLPTLGPEVPRLPIATSSGMQVVSVCAGHSAGTIDDRHVRQVRDGRHLFQALSSMQHSVRSKYTDSDQQTDADMHAAQKRRSRARQATKYALA
jgi:hypothetical protein